MARDSKRLQHIVAMFRDLPEPERHVRIGRAVEALVDGPVRRGAPRRLAWRDAHLAFDNELLKEHRPEWTESQRFDWLAERHGINHKQSHVTIRKRLQAPAAKEARMEFHRPLRQTLARALSRRRPKGTTE